MAGNDTLISWLNDAYALEQHLITVLQHHSSDAAAYPHIQHRLDQHLEETRRHEELVRDCIERLGGSTSLAKTAIGKLSAAFTALSTAVTGDELVKNGISEYSMEHFEIASYKSLIAAAEALGHKDIADVCKQILVDEQRMAEWLDDNLVGIVQQQLAQQVTV